MWRFDSDLEGSRLDRISSGDFIKVKEDPRCQELCFRTKFLNGLSPWSTKSGEHRVPVDGRESGGSLLKFRPRYGGQGAALASSFEATGHEIRWLTRSNLVDSHELCGLGVFWTAS